MTDPLRAVILGIVEGITEFLPISSTGHMILAAQWLGIAEGDPFWSGTFDIFIQIGAILAVVVYFWRRLLGLVMIRPGPTPTEHPVQDAAVDPPTTASDGAAVATMPYVARQVRAAPWYEHILVKLFVAFLPAAVVGLAASDLIERYLKNSAVVAWALILGGVAIVIIEKTMGGRRYADAGTIPLRVALLIGVAQCLSMVPGTSRSAATIMGALLLGLTHAAAAEFSFFLAIPTMFAAGGYSLLKHLHEIRPEQFSLLGLGFFVAFVVALLVVAAFMRFIQTHKFTSFAIYRIVLGGVVLLAIRSGFVP